MYQKKITGRLGNQMFQYAAMLGIKKKINIQQDICLSFEKVKERGFKNELKNFNVSYNEIEKVRLTIEQKFYFYIARIIDKCIEKLYKNKFKREKIQNKFHGKIAPLLVKHGVIYILKGYYDFENIKKVNKNNIYIAGFYECPKYFENVKEELMSEFTPKYDRVEKNKELYNQIESSESVCITIRRGDFLSKEFKNEHYVCTPEYFYKGIEILKEKLKNPKFFIFSDDVEWCKQNMEFPEGTVFETGNDPVWEKLRLMYSCKHFIISNSTFSWWAQYLSKNQNKIVVAPSKWKNEGYTDDIYEENWIKI